MSEARPRPDAGSGSGAKPADASGTSPGELAGEASRESTDLADETRRLLRSLIRFDTVNPPGNERLAQEHLAAHLTKAGFECELLGAEPDRPNLVARLRGERDGPTLCYLGHVDTVLADPADWTHDPWSGDLADGCIWGRGALDMKSQVAAEIAAAASLARSGWRPARGELLIVAVVDEETGGALGAEWITQTHPERVRCDMLVNEGAGCMFEYGGARRYGVCCAEKGVFRFTVTTGGVAGHASMPGMGENALLKMAPLLERLGARRPAYELTDVPRAFLSAIGEDPGDPAGSVARLRAADERLAIMFEPMLGVTFAPTRISASEKINVIPSRAVLRVDCRVPPGLGRGRGQARDHGRDGLPPTRRNGPPPPLRDRVHRAHRRQQLADGFAADGRDLRVGVRARPRARARPRRSCRGSPTRATSARRLETASPTGSSPSATSRCWKRRP